MSAPTPEQREAEPFRWCVYCNVDCNQDVYHHEQDCPTNTGVFPVREKDLLCPGCGVTHTGMICARCNYDFQVGDSYMHVQVEDPPPELEGVEGVEVREIVCMSCAWAAQET